MEEMWTRLDQQWCEGQVEGHRTTAFTQITVKGVLEGMEWRLYPLYRDFCTARAVYSIMFSSLSYVSMFIFQIPKLNPIIVQFKLFMLA